MRESGRCLMCAKKTYRFDESLGKYICSDECKKIVVAWLKGGHA